MVTQLFNKNGHTYRVERTEQQANLFDLERKIIVFVDNQPHRILIENREGFLDVFEASNTEQRYYELLTSYDDYQFKA